MFRATTFGLELSTILNIDSTPELKFYRLIGNIDFSRQSCIDLPLLNLFLKDFIVSMEFSWLL